MILVRGVKGLGREEGSLDKFSRVFIKREVILLSKECGLDEAWILRHGFGWRRKGRRRGRVMETENTERE